MQSVNTRFRAYQLGNPGSSFSYYAGGHFTLLEGRLTDLSSRSLVHEMRACGVEVADTLHITSWDADHCAVSELEGLLDLVRPRRIECPGYDPDKEGAKKCLSIIGQYRASLAATNRSVSVEHITPAYIRSLSTAQSLGFRDIVYHPRDLDSDCANNNSTVKLFRSGSFNVLSLGDVENPAIGAQLRTCRILTRETDVMILAHHGADNGFTNKRLLREVAPRVAICSADYDNTYDHPRQEIRDLLYEERIRLMTTKTGDVIIHSLGDHTGHFRVINLKAGSTEVSSAYDFESKKRKLLSYNQDTVRNLYAKRRTYPRT